MRDRESTRLCADVVDHGDDGVQLAISFVSTTMFGGSSAWGTNSNQNQQQQQQGTSAFGQQQQPQQSAFGGSGAWLDALCVAKSC